MFLGQTKTVYEQEMMLKHELVSQGKSMGEFGLDSGVHFHPQLLLSGATDCQKDCQGLCCQSLLLSRSSDLIILLTLTFR